MNNEDNQEHWRHLYHESGHLVVAVAKGARISQVKFSIDKSSVDFDPRLIEAEDKIKVAAAGEYAQTRFLCRPPLPLEIYEDKIIIDDCVEKIRKKFDKPELEIIHVIMQNAFVLYDHLWPVIDRTAKYLHDKEDIEPEALTNLILNWVDEMQQAD